MKRNVIVVAAIGCILHAFAADLDSPWVRLTAAGASAPGGDGKYAVLLDQSGNGRDFVLASGCQPAADVLRGNVLTTDGWAYSNAHRDGVPAFGSFTFSAWVKRFAKDSQYGLGGLDVLYLLKGLSGLDVWTYSSGTYWMMSFGGKSFDVTVPALRDKWYLLTVTVSDTGATNGENSLCDVKVYADGALLATVGNVELPPQAASSVYLMDDKNMSEYGIYGSIDDVRIYDSALTADEVAALYSSTRTSRMLARLPMDRIDVVEGVRTTPNLAAPGTACPVGSFVNVVDGMEGEGAFSFGPAVGSAAPVDSYVQFVNPVESQVEDVTVMMWQKRNRDMDFTIQTPFLETSQFKLWTPVGGGVHTLLGWFNYYLASVGREEEWVHVAFKFEFFCAFRTDGRARPFVQVKSYRNGEYLATSASFEVAELHQQMAAKDAVWMLGNGCDKDGCWRGQMDDLRIYAGSLTDDEIREIYCGPAKTDAGDDFTVAGPVAELHGACSPHSDFRLSPGYAGDPVWTLVSAPAGGEGAVIESPNTLATKVTLPVAGCYVFALSNEVRSAVSVDTVTVTRDDAAAGAGVAVNPSVKSQEGLCALLAAGSLAGVRVRWTKAAGPGGVWFTHDDAADTLATFSAAGTYVLRCVGSDGVDETEATLEVVVTGSTLAEQLADGLLGYWPCDYNGATDVVKGYQLSSTTSEGFKYVPGVGNDYGLRNGFSGSTYCNSTMPGHPNGQNIRALPVEEWWTLSCWMCHDGDDPNKTWAAALASIYLGNILFYLPKGGSACEFEIYQITPQGQASAARFAGPSYNLTNRWTHVVMQVNQHESGIPEVWVDGVKMEMLSNTTTYGRYLDDSYKCSFGGATFARNFGEAEGGTHDEHNYRYPGFLDEIRVYGRHLSEAEIRCLYEYPTGTKAALAPCVTVPLTAIKMVRRVADDPIDASAYADKPAAGLTYSWRVFAGDASAVSFSDTTALKPVVTISKSGEYRLQLVVSDGVRTTCSAPVPVTVAKTGLCISIR